MYVVAKDSRTRGKKGKSRCQEWIYCASEKCRGLFPRQHKVKGIFYKHQCGFHLCKHCGAYAAKSHPCMVQPAKEPEPSTDYVFFDCECHCTGKHEPYLICIHVGLQNFGDDEHGEALGGYNAEGQWVGEKTGPFNHLGDQVKYFFKGETCVDQFIEWMLDYRNKLGKGFTIIAHNGSGYDWVVIYRQLVLYDNGSLKVQPIYRSTALITMTLGYKTERIRFIDSMLFASGKLANYATTFGVSQKLIDSGYSGNKDFFPHWLGDQVGNDAQVINYSGEMPLPEAYRPQQMYDKKRRSLFEQWYQKESAKYQPITDTPWNFMEQAQEYCDTDVQLLRCAMVEFRNSCLELTMHSVEDAKTGAMLQKGMDPLQFVTLPAFCFAAWRAIFMPSKVGNLPLGVDEFIRAAYTGGRTEAFQFYWKASGDEIAKYIDFVSLYPSVMVECPFPEGHPLYFGNHSHFPRDSVELAGRAELEDLDKYLMEGSLAILKVDLTCPDDLLRPVLGFKEPRRDAAGRETLKYVFSLEPKSGVHVDSPSLRKAISLGYKVTAVHAVMWWPPEQVGPAAVDEKGEFHPDSIFGSYLSRVMHVKDENSGFPKGCDTEEQKQAYCDEYKSNPINMGNSLAIDKVKVPRWFTFTQQHQPTIHSSNAEINSFFLLCFAEEPRNAERCQAHGQQFVRQNRPESHFAQDRHYARRTVR